MEDTFEITTPVTKKVVVLKSWISGAESQDIRLLARAAARVNVGVSGNTSTYDPEALKKAENRTLEAVVVSVDGEKKDVVDKVMALPSKDTDFIIEKVDEVTEGLTEEKKGQ